MDETPSYRRKDLKDCEADVRRNQSEPPGRLLWQQRRMGQPPNKQQLPLLLASQLPKQFDYILISFWNFLLVDTQVHTEAKKGSTLRGCVGIG